VSLSDIVTNKLLFRIIIRPIPVAVRSKAWVFGRSLTRIVGSKLILNFIKSITYHVYNK
jgi:hypothetical protein